MGHSPRNIKKNCAVVEVESCTDSPDDPRSGLLHVFRFACFGRRSVWRKPFWVHYGYLFTGFQIPARSWGHSATSWAWFAVYYHCHV